LLFYSVSGNAISMILIPLCKINGDTNDGNGTDVEVYPSDTFYLGVSKFEFFVIFFISL
jgi:hypothetical protein